jgi:hypothetical protein
MSYPCCFPPTVQLTRCDFPPLSISWGMEQSVIATSAPGSNRTHSLNVHRAMLNVLQLVGFRVVDVVPESR